MLIYERFLDKLSAAKKAHFGTIGPRDHRWTVDEIIRRARKETGDEIDRASVVRFLRARGYNSLDPAPESNGSEDIPPSELINVVDEAITTTFGIERDMQIALRRNIEQLESGLTVVDGSREKSVPSGRIDITARDANGTTVVIELKAGEAQADAVTQIAAYIGDLMEAGDEVRGILVAGSFHPRAIAAARPFPTLELKTYDISFTFQSIGKERLAKF